eukprot:10846358-Alexandrium_andersonii.AAC.1
MPIAHSIDNDRLLAKQGRLHPPPWTCTICEGCPRMIATEGFRYQLSIETAVAIRPGLNCHRSFNGLGGGGCQFVLNQ